MRKLPRLAAGGMAWPGGQAPQEGYPGCRSGRVLSKMENGRPGAEFRAGPFPETQVTSSTTYPAYSPSMSTPCQR